MGFQERGEAFDFQVGPATLFPKMGVLLCLSFVGVFENPSEMAITGGDE